MMTSEKNGDSLTVKYVNCKGDIYYLHEGRMKTGIPQYFFSMKHDGLLAESVPEGYEIYENPNGRVFLRRVVPKKVTDKEVSIVENAIRQFAQVKYFKIDVRENTITVYLPDQDLDPLINEFSALGLGNRSKFHELLKRNMYYSPMMRFILAEEEGRRFVVERMCFLGPEDEWLFLEGPNNLSKLVKKYFPHLGKDSFFELM